MLQITCIWLIKDLKLYLCEQRTTQHNRDPKKAGPSASAALKRQQIWIVSSLRIARFSVNCFEIKNFQNEISTNNAKFEIDSFSPTLRLSLVWWKMSDIRICGQPLFRNT